MDDYRFDLGVSNKYMFGVELEFTGIYLDNLARIFSDSKVPVKFILDHKNKYVNYNMWYLDCDRTVTVDVQDRFYNGELSSRIMTDRKEVWQELKLICQLLRSNGVGVNSKCSNHVTVGLSYISDERYFFEVLSKLLVLYENEINLFYMGDSFGIRETKSAYARNIGLSILEKIDKVDFSASDYLFRLCEHSLKVFGKHDGINLRKYPREELMEIRYPNGTVNEKTIQNNINFSLKLIDAIDRGIFDLDYLSKMIANNRDRLYRKLNEGSCSLEDFYRLVDMISINDKDRKDFSKQYERVVKSKTL